MTPRLALLPAALLAAGSAAFAHPVPGDEPVDVIVRPHYDNAVGTSDAASQGVINASLLESRPALRTAEVLEFVPGLIVTQHSGDGKANQYFLRGFNLDHGTDFATRIDGVPLNLPTHAHGHGYTDINGLIPEMVERIEYRKGPYFAQQGDFSSAGAADIVLRDRLAAPLAQFTVGANGFRRLLLAGSVSTARAGTGLFAPAAGALTGALDLQAHDGPWESPQRLRRASGLLRWTERVAGGDASLTLSHHQARWNATDQVPLRAVEAGLIGRFGAVDPTAGGDTARTSLSGSWRRTLDDGLVEARAYAFRYDLDLFSNFTYFLDRPEAGDQFRQSDRRAVTGGQLRRLWTGRPGGLPMTNELGLQLRHDRIRVGLFDSVGRVRTDIVRDDRVRQTSVGLYAENGIAWTPWLRTVAGLRADHYRFDVRADLPANTGRDDDLQVSPKLSVILGPWARTEFFVNVGRGFHSNDARGTVTRVDPRSGEAVQPVPGIVPTRGRELGVRTEIVPGLQSSLALWRLDIGSELVFVGDAGTTEPGRPSRRQGIEWSNRWTPWPWLLVDVDLAWTRARFSDGDPAGDRIPGSVGRVASAAFTVRDVGPWSASLQLRHLGARPLTEDGSQASRAFTLANLRLGHRLTKNVDVFVDVFNLTDRKASDIEYFYESRLRGEATPVADRHFHPVEPRTARVTLRVAL